SALPAKGEVTTFQPARPLLMLSMVESCLATVNGSLYEVEIVPTNPICCVIGARAAKNVKGSCLSKKCGIDFSLIYNPSATKTKLKPAFSALRAISSCNSKFVLASLGTSLDFQACI